MIRRRLHEEDDLLPAEEQDRSVGGTPRSSTERDEDAVAGRRVVPSDDPVESDEGPVGDAEADEGLPDLTELEAIPEFPEDPSEEDLARLQIQLEAVLFASTEGLTTSRLADVLGTSVPVVKGSLERLADDLQQQSRPYELREHGGSWRLYTREEFYPYLLRLKSLKKVEKLTPAALETLAIVAYRQPVIRAEVEAIRGVRSGPLLRALLDRKLIRVVGRAEVPGAPLQYGTTQSFLDRFGLKAIRDLPSLKEFRQGRI